MMIAAPSRVSTPFSISHPFVDCPLFIHPPHSTSLPPSRRPTTSFTASFVNNAAQRFDYEAKQLRESQIPRKLKIGIVGFGNFGQFLAERIVKHGHTVLAFSRTNYSELGRKMGEQFFRDADDFCEEHPEVILLCTSILSTETVLRSLPVQRLRRNTLFVDVLSVKQFPKNLLLQVLPPEFDVLCTHPMFGPQSGKESWKNLPLVYERVRIGKGYRKDRCDRFLEIFQHQGCRMVEMPCEEHDRHAASSQFITHTVGRILGNLNLSSTPINTRGYESLLELVTNTEDDSFDLYYGLFMYNINAIEERLELAFDSVKKQLFGQLHNVLQRQLFDHGNAGPTTNPVHSSENVSIQIAKVNYPVDSVGYGVNGFGSGVNGFAS